MKGFITKDIRILSKQKNFLFMIIIMSVIFGIIFENMSFMNSYLAFFSAIYVLGTLNYDEFDNGMAYLMAMPSNKKDYIFSKYLLMIITITIMSMLGFLLNFVYTIIKGIPFNLMENIISIVASNILSLLVMNIMLPIKLKFGNDKSRIVMIIVYGLLFLVGFLLINIINKYNPILLTNMLVYIENNPLVISVSGIVIILLLSLISYMISHSILLKKEF